MLARFEQRLDLLVSQRRDIAPRHRTLRAAIDWSYRALAPELQRFFETNSPAAKADRATAKK